MNTFQHLTVLFHHFYSAFLVTLHIYCMYAGVYVCLCAPVSECVCVYGDLSALEPQMVKSLFSISGISVETDAHAGLLVCVPIVSKPVCAPRLLLNLVPLTPYHEEVETMRITL